MPASMYVVERVNIGVSISRRLSCQYAGTRSSSVTRAAVCNGANVEYGYMIDVRTRCSNKNPFPCATGPRPQGPTPGISASHGPFMSSKGLIGCRPHAHVRQCICVFLWNGKPREVEEVPVIPMREDIVREVSPPIQWTDHVLRGARAYAFLGEDFH